jgi:hypothetical protein
MGRLIFLLEEPSMRALLEGLLPRLFPDVPFLCVTHNGKADLERSIRDTLRNWRTPGDRFIILRDSDGADCGEVKDRILQLCHEGRREDTLIRIVCQELEAWYLGDPDAMAAAFGENELRNIRDKPRYRFPDNVTKPSQHVDRLVGEYGKVAGARLMAQHLTREGNRSPSFEVFVSGIERLLRLQ